MPLTKRKKIIELQPLVACLPGYEEKKFETKFRLTPKIYYKTGSELRLEQSQKIKLLNW